MPTMFCLLGRVVFVVIGAGREGETEQLVADRQSGRIRKVDGKSPSAAAGIAIDIRAIIGPNPAEISRITCTASSRVSASVPNV